MIIELPEYYANINRVMILETECSAIGGDLISRLIINEAQIPMTVNRGYDLPAYVDEQTLVIACSYSGYTEETISAFAQALDINARCMVISTGGKLKEIAEKASAPVHLRLQCPTAPPCHSASWQSTVPCSSALSG